MAIVSSLFYSLGYNKNSHSERLSYNLYENIITILSVSSDDYLHASLPSLSSECGSYTSYSEDKNKGIKKLKNTNKN